MLVNESPESILIIWENTMETQRLLSFRQPLQESVDHGVKLLCLRVHVCRKRLPNTLVSRVKSSSPTFNLIHYIHDSQEKEKDTWCCTLQM